MEFTMSDDDSDNAIHDLLSVPSVVHKDVLLEPLYTVQEIQVGEYEESPIDVVRQLVKGRRAQSEFADETPPAIFVEMLLLTTQDDYTGYRMPNYYWTENARWIKYEETVEEGGKRWSKPHVTIVTLPSLLQLRNCLKKGATLLDVEAEDFSELTNLILAQWETKAYLDAEEADHLRRIMLSPKQHLYKSEFRDRLRLQKTPTSESALHKLPLRTHSSVPSIDEEGAETGSLSKQSGSGSADGKLEIRGTSQDDVQDDDDAGHALASKATGNTQLLRKLQEGSEAANILIGQHDDLSAPMVAFVRLKQAKTFLDTPEVAIPTRFVIVILVPFNHTIREIELIGRCFGTILVDPIFSCVAYRARTANELCQGVDEFLSQSLVMPPGRWSTDFRWEPSEEARKVERDVGKSIRKMTIIPKGAASHSHVPPELQRTGRCFGGFINDIKRKAPLYVSDFADVFKSGSSFTQCLASSMFLFFANIAIIITFAGVMEKLLDENMGAMENLLAAGICGVSFALLAGQPLCILSATGPVLVFEVILYGMCNDFGWAFLPTRFWVGAWSCLFLLLIVAVDGNSFIAWITKFTEEAFATLISVIFIIQAFEKLISIGHEAPLTTDPDAVLKDPCVCNITDIPFFPNNQSYQKIPEVCKSAGGKSEGLQCTFFPDVFLFSVILFFATFFIAIGLKFFRNSRYFPTRIRTILADFNVFIAIVLMTGLATLVGLDVEGLVMPKSFRPTVEGRPWVINPFDVTPRWWLGLAAAVPAALFIILVVMDQQITSVIINRKENKLKKGYGYYLDLVVVAILILVCATLGIPFFVAGTVNSIIHVDSLKMMSEVAAPGEKPQFLGVREQRITPMVAHLLIGLSVFLTPVIKLIPLAVLLGVFLYMGVVSLIDQEFVHRFALLFMPVKYQPDYKFLRLVPLKRVHIFTLIQFVALLILVAVKYGKTISMVFPLMLVILMLIRKLMDYCFTEKELYALDDPLPPFRELIWSGSKIAAGQSSDKAAIIDEDQLAETERKGSGCCGKIKKGRKGKPDKRLKNELALDMD